MAVVGAVGAIVDGAADGTYIIQKGAAISNDSTKRKIVIK